ncbi:MAG: hypothetical protein KBG48_22045 [Kofleriaceae bacterium]|jgi:hypothetical protein|nr:hypothetical protein [Kofleriaceae bacterium]MBP9170104.1 hypothetical protein [Kofleriaceae bacterium]MBP9859954.1 hypothetical protein [Kofleriaceae bacterium]
MKTLATLLLATATGACVSTIGATERERDRGGDCTTDNEERLDTVVVRTQADVDDLPDCFSVDGDLIVEGSPLVDLKAFEQLGYVGGDLILRDNSRLTSLDGLVDIDVGGDLTVEGNARLTDLTGLEATTSLGALTIRDNAALETLGGLADLATVTGAVVIEGNPRLDSLAGLGALRRAGAVSIVDNDALVGLSALSNLGTADALTVRGNARLSSVSGMSELLSVTALTIHDNPALLSLNGLAITDVTGDVDLSANGLTTLASRLSLTRVGGDLVIDGHGALTAVDGLAPALRVTGAITLSNNAGLRSVYPLYVGTTAAQLVVMSNPSLSRDRAEHLRNHTAQFPTVTVQANGPYGADPETHGN